MTSINHTAIASHSAEQMYALADDIAAYPDFLPWCTGAGVTRSDDSVEARLDIQYYGFRTAFSTRNIHTPHSHISMQLVSGPLSALQGQWRFIALEQNRCRIEFDLQYEFSSKLMAAAMSKMFSYIFDDFVDHFIDRARSQYRTIGVEIVQAADMAAGSRTLQLPDGATVADALHAADLPYSESVSVFGRLADKTTPLASGDRIEINQPLPNPPQQARRQRQ